MYKEKRERGRKKDLLILIFFRAPAVFPLGLSFDAARNAS
jgi:hypothetical protein